MKKKLLIAVSVVALLVAAMAVGIYAYQIDFGTDYLESSIGRIKISGYLFTTSGTYDYGAETVTAQAISSQGVQEIAARVVGSPEASTDDPGDVAITAYGNVSASTHTAVSSIHDVYIYVE